MTQVRFVDTTLRDGQLSLWASNMTTGMMLPVVERFDHAGFNGSHQRRYRFESSRVIFGLGRY